MHCSGSVNVNFREFEELINSGAEEITLTEDVVLDFSDEEIDRDCIEIPKLIIEGDGHSVSLNIQNIDFIFDDECIFKNIKLDSYNNLKITWTGFVKLENCTFKNFELISQESLHICDCNFKDFTILINEGITHAKNSKIYKFINSGEAYFKNSRLFGLSNVYGGDVQLKNCKLSYSVNEGKLILCDCNIVDSLNNFSKNLKIINCHFENIVSVKDGGAIRNKKGTIHIENTVFKENTADYDRSGGAIANIDGEIILENCEFIRNWSGRYGGAIYNENGSLNVLNCNFSNNCTTYLGETCYHAADTIFNLNGTVNIENSNFKSHNNDNIYNDGILNIFNSNIVGDMLNRGCLSIKKCKFEKGSSIENSALIYLSKSEEEYLNNFIEKHGEKRGIFGFNSPGPSYMVGGTGKIRYLDELCAGENKNDFKYLNDLINFNSENDDCLEIHLDRDIINNDKSFENGIEISEMKLFIDGNGHIIDANRKSGIFNISSAKVTLRNIIFKNSFSNMAAINISNANITLENCIFESNDSVKSGGSLNIKDSSLITIDCEFIDNFASRGGAIYGNKSSIELLGCEFSKNSAEKVGATISLDNSDLICLKSNFNKNIAQYGAACVSKDSNLSFHDCDFKKNLGYNGAAIATRDSFLKFEQCNFEKNKSKDSSIAYGSGDVKFIVKKSKFICNQTYHALILMAIGDGYGLSGRLYCSECKFENNDVRSNLIKVRQLYMSNCDFRNNQYGDELINVKEFLLRDDNPLESKIKAEQVIENANTGIDFKSLIDSGEKDISLKSDYIFFEDGKLDADGLCIDGQMHEITGNLTITGKNVTLKNIIFKDTVKIENNDTATLENCSFERRFKNEVIINKVNLTLKNCSFKKKHNILNTGEVTLIDDDGTEVLTDEIIELYEEESVCGLGALFRKPHKKRPKN